MALRDIEKEVRRDMEDGLDFEKRIIKVCKTLIYRPEPNNGCVVHISTPKTEAGERTIPMIDEVYDAFLEEYQIQKVLGFGNNEIDGFSGFVFSTGEGKNENINTFILVRICEALECDTSDIMEIEKEGDQEDV